MNMEKEIIVALITAGGVIIAAIINHVGNRKKPKGKSERDIKINQRAKGETVTQVGIQIDLEKRDDPNE